MMRTETVPEVIYATDTLVVQANITQEGSLHSLCFLPGPKQEGSFPEINQEELTVFLETLRMEVEAFYPLED